MKEENSLKSQDRALTEKKTFFAVAIILEIFPSLIWRYQMNKDQYN